MDDAPAPTLRELVAVASLQLTVHAAPPDALRTRVRWAHSTELPDPAPYLRGGELVCTVGAALTSAARCQAFVSSLVGAGAAGLCFGLGDMHDDVPPALVAQCVALGVPLLVAPLGAPFSAISEHLASRRVAAQTQVTRTAEVLVSRLLTGVRSHASVASLLDSAVEVLGGRLDLRVDGRSLAVAGAPDGRGEVQVSAPVLAGGELQWSGDAGAVSRRLLEQLSRVVEVALSERDIEATLRRERVGQLLLLVQDRLLDPAALGQALDEARLARQSLVVSAWPGGAAALLAAQMDEGQFAEGLVGEAPGVTLAVTASAASVGPAARALTLPCGHSSIVELAQLARGVSEARAALELALGQGGVVGPAGLTSLEGLLEQQPVERLEPFVVQLMAPLVASDRHRGTHYLQTLRAFLRHDGSLQRTARELFVHVNTVRHRLARMQQLTGRNPLNFADRVALAIALWAWDRRGGAAGRATAR